MNNVMVINGYKAVIAFAPEIEMFRGEFIGLHGGAEFYAADVAGLRREGELSLKVFFEECARRGVEPLKNFSGKFVIRLAPKTHAAAAVAAAAHGQSLNQWATEALEMKTPAQAYALAA